MRVGMDFYAKIVRDMHSFGLRLVTLDLRICHKDTVTVCKYIIVIGTLTRQLQEEIEDMSNKFSCRWGLTQRQTRA